MKYATVEEYRRICGDNESFDEDIIKNIILAEAKAEELTFGRLRALYEKEALTPFRRECVKIFVCFQARYTQENGEDADSGVSSYSVGSISVTVRGGRSEADALHVSSVALGFLDRSGLRWRGV